MFLRIFFWFISTHVIWSIIFNLIGSILLRTKKRKLQDIGLYLYACSFAPWFGIGQDRIFKACYKIDHYMRCDCKKCKHWTCRYYKKGFNEKY